MVGDVDDDDDFDDFDDFDDDDDDDEDVDDEEEEEEDDDDPPQTFAYFSDQNNQPEAVRGIKTAQSCFRSERPNTSLASLRQGHVLTRVN